MPKITVQDLVDALKMLQNRETLDILLKTLEKGQDVDFNLRFIVASFARPELFQGFLICYYIINEKLYQKTAA